MLLAIPGMIGEALGALKAIAARGKVQDMPHRVMVALVTAMVAVFETTSAQERKNRAVAIATGGRASRRGAEPGSLDTRLLTGDRARSGLL